MLARGQTYKSISLELKALYPHIQRGLSERSVRRYVKENNLKAQDVVAAVHQSVSEVSED